MSIGSKVRVYKTSVRPIVAYAIETRAETTITKRLLRTAEMKTLRQTPCGTESETTTWGKDAIYRMW